MEKSQPPAPGEERKPEPIWALLPLDEFRPPASAAPEVVRSGLADLWKRLVGREHQDDDPRAAASLRSPSQELLDWAAPAPVCPVDRLAGADSALAAWLEREPESAGVLSVVDSPVANLDQDLSEWAAAEGFTLLSPPTAAQILQGDTDWLDTLPLNSPKRLLLPNLERCFLRHHNGLDLLRGLIDRIDQQQPALLIVCQSWAWRFLSLVTQVDALCGAPLVLAPFDARRLNRWLSNCAEASSPYDFVFREARTGKTVLERSGGDGEDPPDPSAFLKHLAAASRGDPYLAWHIWRRSLLTARDENVDNAAKEAAADDAGYTIWVRPWEEVKLPDLTRRASKEDGMFLYTLLLRGALSFDLAVALLPHSSDRLRHSLQHLSREGVIRQKDGLWHLAPIGYPAVRRLLIDEGYLSDEL
ncbi:MAG: hypothetical protein WBO46_21305 [Caldilineaceae bacterium]